MAATVAKPQHLVALERAVEVKSARAAIKHEIAALDRKAGQRRAAQVIANPPEELRSMPVAFLIGAIHRQGEALTCRTLERLGIPERKPLGDLVPRQREVLVVALGAAVPGHADLTRRALGTTPVLPKPKAKPAPKRRVVAVRSSTAWCPRCATDVLLAPDSLACPWCSARTRMAVAA
jgi:hypothetical protein